MTTTRTVSWPLPLSDADSAERKALLAEASRHRWAAGQGIQQDRLTLSVVRPVLPVHIAGVIGSILAAGVIHARTRTSTKEQAA